MASAGLLLTVIVLVAVVRQRLVELRTRVERQRVRREPAPQAAYESKLVRALIAGIHAKRQLALVG